MELNEATTSNSATDGQNGAGEFSGSAATDYGTSIPATGLRGKLDTAKTKVVDGAHAATDWVKQADLEGIKTGIEQQVRSNPTRSLLVALGVGYLLGRVMRGNGS